MGCKCTDDVNVDIHKKHCFFKLYKEEELKLK